MTHCGLFITATDTGVGKTYLTVLIARALRAKGVRVGAYKPVCSGAERAADGSVHWNDVDALSDALEGEFDDRRVCLHRLVAPLAPPVAARREGTVLEFDRLRDEPCIGGENGVDVLLVEGVGGLLCPLTEKQSIADLAATLDYPLLVVARLGLGTINHTLLTIEAAQNRGLTIAGIVLNESEPLPAEPGHEENPDEIAVRTNVPVLGVVRHGASGLQSIDGRVIPMDWLRLIRDSCAARD